MPSDLVPRQENVGTADVAASLLLIAARNEGARQGYRRDSNWVGGAAGRLRRKAEGGRANC